MAKTLYCSFCGKSQHEVSKLIAGPKVQICDECVDFCIDILDDDDQGWRERLTKLEESRARPGKPRDPAVERQRRDRRSWLGRLGRWLRSVRTDEIQTSAI